MTYPEPDLNPPEPVEEHESSDDWKEERDLEAQLNKTEYLEN